jgi:hypothetical protein
MPRLVSAAALAALAGVKPGAIYYAKKSGRICPTEGNQYDLDDPKVSDYVMGASVKSRAQRGLTENTDHRKASAKSSLESEKIQAEIDLKKKQARKFDREHEVAIGNLIHLADVELIFGAIASGIRTNFLPIGNRIGRGNTKLRDRVEREVTKAIEKTLRNAKRDVERYIDKEILND